MILPAAIQAYIDGVTVPLISISLVDTAPDSIAWGTIGKLQILPAVTVSIPASPLPLVNANLNQSIPYTVMTLPPQKMKGNHTLFMSHQRRPILDMEMLQNTLTDVLMNDISYVSFRAKPYISIHGLGPFGITFNKDIRIIGWISFWATHLAIDD